MGGPEPSQSACLQFSKQDINKKKGLIESIPSGDEKKEKNDWLAHFFFKWDKSDFLISVKRNNS